MASISIKTVTNCIARIKHHLLWAHTRPRGFRQNLQRDSSSLEPPFGLDTPNHQACHDLPTSQCCKPSSSCVNTCIMVGCIQYTIMATTLASRRLKRLLITHSSDSNHEPKQHSRGYVDKLDMSFTRYATYYAKLLIWQFILTVIAHQLMSGFVSMSIGQVYLWNHYSFILKNICVFMKFCLTQYCHFIRLGTILSIPRDRRGRHIES